MKKVNLELTLDNIAAAVAPVVVPAVIKALEPKFNAIDAKFDKIDARFDALELHMDKKIDSAFNDLAAMTAKEFGIVHKEINKLAWRMEMLA